MDKQEYKILLEEIMSLTEDEKFVEAAEIADRINWRKVPSFSVLQKISNLYKINKRYEEALEIIYLAYYRNPKSRSILYSLCELCIENNDIGNAVKYLAEYKKVAPREPDAMILQYEILEQQEAPLEDRIDILEELNRKYYKEEWAYQLAYLYHRVGLATKCVETCDQLITWFGDGPFVIKAMELKMLHGKLSPKQQAVYDRRNDYAEELEAYEGDEYVEETSETVDLSDALEDDFHVKTIDMGKFNTINLQKELAKNMRELMGDDFDKKPGSVTSQLIKPLVEDGGIMDTSAELASEDDILGKYRNTKKFAKVEKKSNDAEGQGSRANGRNAGDFEDAAYAGGGYAEGGYSGEGGYTEDSAGYEEAGYAEDSAGYEEAGYAEDSAGYEEAGYAEDNDGYEEAGYAEDNAGYEGGYADGEYIDENGEYILQEGDQVLYEGEDGRLYYENGELFEEELYYEDGSVYQPGGQMEEAAMEQPEEIAQEQSLSAKVDQEFANRSTMIFTREQQDAIRGNAVSGQQEYQSFSAQGFQNGNNQDNIEESVQDAIRNTARLARVSEEAPQADSIRSALDRQPENPEEIGMDFSEPKSQEAYTVPDSKTGEIFFEDKTGDIVMDKVPVEVMGDVIAAMVPEKEEELPRQGIDIHEVEIEKQPITNTRKETFEDVLTLDQDGQISLVVPEENMLEKQITGQMNLEEMLANWESIRSHQEEKQKANLHQNILDKTGPLFDEFDENGKNDLLSRLEEEHKASKRVISNDLELKKVEEVGNGMEGADAKIEHISIWDEVDAAVEADRREAEEKARAAKAASGVGESVAGVASAAISGAAGLGAAAVEGAGAAASAAAGAGIAAAAAGLGTEAANVGAAAGLAANAVSGIAADTVSGIAGAEGERSGRDGTASDEASVAAGIDADTLAEEAVPAMGRAVGAQNVEGQEAYAAEEGEAGTDSAYAEESSDGTTYVDENGETVYEDGAAYVDENGETVYEDGAAYVDENGEAVYEDGAAYVDENGEPVYADGDATEEGAAYIDENGNAIYAGEESDYDNQGEAVYESVDGADADLAEQTADAAGQQGGDQASLNTSEINSIADALEAAADRTKIETVDEIQDEYTEDGEEEREFSPEEKELFADFLYSKKLRRQILDAVDMVSLASYVGNVIVTGETGTGVVEMAKDIIKEVQLTDSNFVSSKVAKISGAKMNRKDIASMFAQLSNGALIVERASDMNRDTLEAITKALENSADGILIVLTDSKKAVDQMLAGYEMLSGYFNVRIDITPMSNNALVGYAKKYAYGREYKIDEEKAVLALHQRISELQIGDHNVTQKEIEDIVDAAIAHAKKPRLGTYFSILGGKRYDYEDMIILKEKDFIR